MKKFKEYFLTTVGVIILVLATRFFLEPNNIAGGGIYGLSMVLNHFIPISVGFLMLIMNVILFLIAFLVIGNKFGAKSIYTSIALSSGIWLLDRFVDKSVCVTNNLILATIFGTILSGIGMALVFNQNASTGGTDIIAKILNKFFHLDIGKALLMVDFSITLFAGAAFGADIGMYSLLSVLINGFVIDYAIEGFNSRKEVIIISQKTKEISKYIIEELSRGCTFVNAKGAYTGQETYILYSVVGRRQFIKLRGYIQQVDEKAFITVNEVHEVLGDGFDKIASE